MHSPVNNLCDRVCLKRGVSAAFPSCRGCVFSNLSSPHRAELVHTSPTHVRGHFGSRAISVPVNIVAVSAHVFHSSILVSCVYTSSANVGLFHNDLCASPCFVDLAYDPAEECG